MHYTILYYIYVKHIVHGYTCVVVTGPGECHNAFLDLWRSNRGDMEPRYFPTTKPGSMLAKI